MKNLLIFIALTSFAFAGAAQNTPTKKADSKKTATAKKSPTRAKKISTTAKKPTPVKKDDNGDLEKALAMERPDDKIAALTKFLVDHPKSALRPRALESLTAARIVSGEARFEAGERENALKLYRIAIKEAPVPYPERLFNEVISKVPPGLYFHGEQAGAVEMALAIEANAGASMPQLLSVAGFYLLMENGDEGKRLAEAALKLDEKSAAAQLMIGMAHRLNFDLEASAAAFAKALELDPESASARRSLADMKRAVGKPAEALALYDVLLAKDAEDLQSRNGRILSLFAIGKRVEAEAELAKAIEANPANVPLLAGAAYWYAAVGDSTKAIDLAGKAIATDPRYIWSHIALGRAMLAEGRFSDAEQVLVKARKYGNFATLEYEIASTRLAGGFYREAAEELQKSFAVKDGMITTKLGRRVERSEKGFVDLVAHERRASILEPKSADTHENAELLKALLEFKTVLAEATPDQTRAADLAEAFTKGIDKMRFHRQIYAANELLEKKVAAAKAGELAKSAVASVDDGLGIPIPAAPIMASELYASRVAAINAERYILVPDVPKHTLSVIARGRIEEIAGWSLLQQGSNADAAIRLRRAVSILPEKSVWWRSSYWRLGQALEGDGKDKDALDAYVKSYQTGDPDGAKYAAIEAIYKKAKGNTEGLETLIGANPVKPEEKKPVENTVTIDATKAEKLPEKTEEKSAAKHTASKDEKTTEEKPVEKPKTATETETKKPLFDPVIIEIKKDTSETRKVPGNTEAQKTENTGEKPAPTNETAADNSTGRPRVVEGKEVNTDEIKPCSISVSQENISLIGGGGSVGVIVGITDGDLKQLTAAASSPKDIEVVPDPEISPTSSRLLFVVRSLTTASGVYQVTFSAPCGKKELVVKVR